MFSKRITVIGLMVAMLATPMTLSARDLVRDVFTGVVKDVIVDEVRESRKPAPKVVVRRTNVVTTTSTTSQSNREINRVTQTALNYFDFQAGTPDGILGRKSRAAISQYQSYLGYSKTGHLTEYQRDFLVRSYYRAVSGDQTTPGLVAQDPYAARNLLRVYQEQSGGVAPGRQANEGTNPTAPATPSSLPTPMAAEDPQVLLSSHCNRINLTTNANGGLVTEATMSDPEFTLNEQFCLARSYAIVLGEDLAGQVKGVSRAQFEEQCAAFGPTMQDYMAALSQAPRDQVLQDVSSFVLSTGMSPAQLGDTARVCLSVGYSTDSLDVALGSALLLTALGEAAYGELLGHHLTQGFGISRRPDLALEWYQASFDAISDGAPAVFAPEDSDRGALIQKAALQLSGGGQAQSGSILPVFSVGSDTGN